MKTDFGAQLARIRDITRTWFFPACIVAAGLFAFRVLFDYAPYTGIEQVSDETESMFFSPNQGSPGLIFGVAAWIVLGRRNLIRASLGAASAVVPTIVFLSLSIAFYLWAHFVSAPDLTVVALIFSILGSGALLGGRAGMRAIWLPAVFLVMLIPVPAVLINDVVFDLQLFTARFTVGFLELVGVRALELGDLMFTRERVFQVIESCAGLRMIDTLTMSAVLYAELFYRSRLQSVILLISAPLIGILVNQLRVLSVVFTPHSELGGEHATQGIAMIVAGVLLIAALDALLTRSLPDPPPRKPFIPKPASERDLPLAARTVVVCTVLLSLGLSTFIVDPWQRPRSIQRPLFEFKSEIDGWVGSGLPIDRQFLGTAGFSQWLHRRYRRDQVEVDIFLASDDRFERRVSLRSDKTAWPGSGYRPLRAGTIELTASGPLADSWVLDSPKGPLLVYRWYEDVESLWVETLRSFFALDQSPFRRPRRGLVARVNTFVPKGLAGPAEAEERLRSFLPFALSEIAKLQNPLGAQRATGGPQVVAQRAAVVPD